MRLSRASVVVTIGVVLVVVVLGAYYTTAYQAARGQARDVALSGPMPGPGLADSSWGVRLGEPGPADLAIGLAGFPRSTSPTSMTFSFILTNNADSQAPTLPVFVTVELTLQGWRVTADGIEG